MKEEIKELINVAINGGALPADDILSLFNLALALEKMQNEPESNVFGFDQSQIGQLNEKMTTYLEENPNIFRTGEIYSSIWDVDEDLMDTNLYFTTLDFYYQDVLAEKNLESFEFVLVLYDLGKPLADEYLESHPIPAGNYDQVKESIDLLQQNPLQDDDLIEYKKSELVEIIRRDYSDNSEMMSWAEEQQPSIEDTSDRSLGIPNIIPNVLPNVLGNANVPWNSAKQNRENSNEVKQKSSKLKTLSLVAVIILSVILLMGGAVILALLLIVIWVLLFCTPLGNLIPAIKNSKKK